MKNVLKMLLAMVFLVMTVVAAGATQVTVDLDKIPSDLAAKILDAQKAPATTEPPITPSQAKEWADIGRSIGDAIAATAQSLSVGVNDFIKTPAGKMSVFVLFMYIIGWKLWTIIAGVVIWLVLGTTIFHSYRRLHLPTKYTITDEGNPGKEKVLFGSYQFKDDGERLVSLWGHYISFVALAVVMLFIIL